MHPSGGQLYFLPVPRYASCVHQNQDASGRPVQHLNRLQRRKNKRQAPCLRFSGRTSGSWSGNGTLLPWSSVQTTTAASAPASPQTRRVKCSQGTRALCHKEQVPWLFKVLPVSTVATTSRPQKEGRSLRTLSFQQPTEAPSASDRAYHPAARSSTWEKTNWGRVQIEILGKDLHPISTQKHPEASRAHSLVHGKLEVQALDPCMVPGWGE